MAKIIEFPAQNQDESSQPNYAGHLLMLDLNKARKWQCFNFWVGVRTRIAPVPEDASMDRIHEAVQAGILIDITEHPELFIPEKPVADVTESDTGKRLYSGTRQWFRDLGVPDDDETAPVDEVVSFATDDPELQKRIEQALAAAPAPAAPKPAVRPKSVLALPPGMDNPGLYELPVPRG
jgi:hypothetical protein